MVSPQVKYGGILITKSVKAFSYLLSGDISCYADCSNARQKIRLVGETMGGVVFVPRGHCDFIPPEAAGGNFEEIDAPRGVWGLVRFLRKRRPALFGFGYGVSNEKSLFNAIVLSLFSGVPIVLFCWDPPGNTVRNRRNVVSRVRSKVMDLLMGLAVRYSAGMIMNLHPGFLEGRISKSVQGKIFAFPNGTTIEKNLSYVCASKRVPKRFVVACRVNELKGCWDVVNFFLKLFQNDNEVSLAWIGGGKDREVHQYLIEKGIPASQLIMTGNVERETSLEVMSTASFAINMYPDVPSLRWNYVLKGPEFLSFGLPIITNDAPGMGEYAIDGETGVVFAPGDIDVAVEKTIRVMEDKSLYDRISVAAIERSKKYDWCSINNAIARQIEVLIMGERK